MKKARYIVLVCTLTAAASLPGLALAQGKPAPAKPSNDTSMFDGKGTSMFDG